MWSGVQGSVAVTGDQNRRLPFECVWWWRGGREGQINIEGPEPVLGFAPVPCPMPIYPSLLRLGYNTQPWTVCILVSVCVCVCDFQITSRPPNPPSLPLNPATWPYLLYEKRDRQTDKLKISASHVRSEIIVNMITLLPSYPCHLCLITYGKKIISTALPYRLQARTSKQAPLTLKTIIMFYMY